MSGIVSKNLGRASGIVGAGDIGADAVDSANIADDAIDSEHYAATSIDTAHRATNQIDETLIKDAFLAEFTKVTVATGDSILLGDLNDSGNTKRDTVQGVLDLVHGATVGLQTIWIPAAAMRPTDRNGCDAITSVQTSNDKPDMMVMDFDASADEHAQFHVAFPKSWNESTIQYEVYWCSTATDTDPVHWGLKGVSVPDNSTIDVAYGTHINVADANQGAAEEMLVSPLSSALTIAGAAVDTVTFFDVFRDVSEETSGAAEDARLIGVKLFFTTNAENDA